MLVEGRNGKPPVPARQLVPACIVGTALFVAACMVWAVPHIESTVEDAARHDLEAAGIDTAGLTIDADFRTLVVSGALPAGVSADDVTAALADTDGVRDVTVEATP